MCVGHLEGHLGSVDGVVLLEPYPPTNVASPMKVWKMMFLLRIVVDGSVAVFH